MADAASFSPLWGEWYIKELIGHGSFGAVYKAEKTEYGNTYVSAVKHLSIPPANMTKTSLAAEGIATDEHSWQMYCDTLRDQIIREINFCYTLRGNTNIVAYEDHCIIPKTDSIGYDIFIRMELLTPLTQYMTEHPLTEQNVIELGIAICDALELLNRHHMIHRDIKPANIFVNNMGTYKLGDFGESKVLSGQSAGMTVRGTYSYMSPEISKGASADITADIYSLGLVMYRLLNGNRAPFLPLNVPTVDVAAVEQSNIRRFSGEPLPPPAFCRNTALTAIIQRACAFYPQERWHTPQEMKQALTNLSNGTAAYSLPIPPHAANTSVRGDYPYGMMTPSVMPQSMTPPPVGKKNKLPLVIGGIIGAVVLVGVIVTIVLVSRANRSDKTDTPPADSTVVSEPGTVVSQPSTVMSEPSTVLSQPAASSVEGISLRTFLASASGQALQRTMQEQAQQQLDQSPVPMTFSMYAEGEDTLVYEYRYEAVVSLNETQKAAVRKAMNENLPTVQAEMRTFMSTYGIRPYTTLYRYKSTTGEVLIELPVTL